MRSLQKEKEPDLRFLCSAPPAHFLGRLFPFLSLPDSSVTLSPMARARRCLHMSMQTCIEMHVYKLPYLRASLRVSARNLKFFQAVLMVCLLLCLVEPLLIAPSFFLRFASMERESSSSSTLKEARPPSSSCSVWWISPFPPRKFLRSRLHSRFSSSECIRAASQYSACAAFLFRGMDG